MTRAELVAELRGIETRGSEFSDDPEVWGAILGAAMSVRERIKEAHRQPEPSDNGNDDGA